MPTPNQQIPSPPRTGLSGCSIAAAIIAVLLAMALGCAGMCAGILYLGRGRVESALDQAGVSLPDISLPEPQTDWEDWMVKRELTHFYQTVLESVTTDKTLITKLGEPIEPDIGAEKLFTRKDKGPLNQDGEHITFEVRGPKGTGQVAADSTAKGSDGIQPEKITVTLGDGSTVDVHLLRRPLPPVR